MNKGGTKSTERNKGQNQQEGTSDKINRKERMTKSSGRNKEQNQQEGTRDKINRKERVTK